MATREEKVQVVANMKDELKSAKGAVLVEFTGLSVAAATQLRRKFREHDVRYHVIKNTLTTIAAKEVGLDDLEPYLYGPNALAVSSSDAVAPAKALKEFVTETKSKSLTIKAGLLEGKVIDVDAVKELSDLPSREVLLAKVVGGMQAPITGMVRCLQGNISNLVYALDAIRQQKEQSA